MELISVIIKICKKFQETVYPFLLEYLSIYKPEFKGHLFKLFFPLAVFIYIRNKALYFIPEDNINSSRCN